jgi:hypothetical protein
VSKQLKLQKRRRKRKKKWTLEVAWMCSAERKLEAAIIKQSKHQNVGLKVASRHKLAMPGAEQGTTPQAGDC